MRQIPSGLKAKLESGATSLCRCWLITRRDGVVMGFTDHDQDLTIEGVTCKANTGLQAGELESELGLAAGLGAVQGAVQDEGLSAEDLRNGLYLGAEVQEWVVDWQAPADRVHLHTQTLAKLNEDDGRFVAELEGPMAALAKPMGRVYGRDCDATLGDGRCGVDLADEALSASGTVTAILGPRHFVVSGLAAFAAGWFDRGTLTWGTGDNVGQDHVVSVHRVRDGVHEVHVHSEPDESVQLGDGFEIIAGCDKCLKTCRDKFNNIQNFRGFPHMPGDDFILSAPRAGEHNDGGSQSA